MSHAYYNEFDPPTADWLRELIASGLIAPGEVDTRSIVDVQPADLAGFTHVHFFAGIGGWARALDLAGWPRDRPVWTGSCPCQDFSAAGLGAGHGGARHLWPEMFRLIRECRPPVVFGEQVDAAIRYGWLDGIFTDLEAQVYACGSAVLPAAGKGAPHIRHRIFWVADDKGARPIDAGSRHARPRRAALQPASCGTTGRLPDADGGQPRHGDVQPGGEHGLQPEVSEPLRFPNAASGGLGTNGRAQGKPGLPDECGASRGLGDCEIIRRRGRADDFDGRRGECAPSDSSPLLRRGLAHDAGAGREGHRPEHAARRALQLPAESDGWNDYRIVECTDRDEIGHPKRRRIESRTLPLAHGLPRGVVPGGDPSHAEAQNTGEARTPRLRGYGNAIVPQLAAEFILAYEESLNP